MIQLKAIHARTFKQNKSFLGYGGRVAVCCSFILKIGYTKYVSSRKINSSITSE